MKFKIKMNVSKFEMYNFLLENLKKELSNKNIKEGLKIKKDLITKTNQIVSSTLEISKLEENKEYILKYITNLGINYVRYLIEEINEENINLIYEESYYTDSKWKKYNHIFTEIIYSFFLKRRKKKQLKKIEEYIKENRK